MEFNKSNVWFKERLKNLRPYTSKQEMEFLLLDDEDVNYTKILSVLSDIEPLNEYEAIAFLFKLREISVSDLIELTKPCDHCKFMDLYNIEIKEFFNLTYKSTEVENLPLGIFSKNEDVISNKKANKLILKDYILLEKEITKQTSEVFKLSVERKCKKCNEINTIWINPKQILSKSSHSRIFKEYTDISYYTHNSKLDIDTMYPFHREVVINLINEKLKSQPKGF